jgi:dihydrofolate synthase/folylpolyglutamate synthase
MNYAEAIQFLCGLQMFGAHFGLENTFRLAALAGNPQEKLRFIHVAGTNGKGSTCAMLESIYRAAGLRVGLFTSPHLVSFRERIQVNRKLISEADVARLVEKLERGSPTRSTLKADEVSESSEAPASAKHCGSQTRAPEDRQDACPTLFEFATVMALKYFAEQKCDLVIWETGLGGRLDATNIVTPLASVITNIAFDHTQWLGDTLAKIAFEKAGIIKNGIPVVTGVDEPEALAVIERIAMEKNASLIKAGQASSLSPFEKTKKLETGKMPGLRLPGEHQKRNATLALATVEILQNQIPVSERQIRDGLQNVNWPGRLQLIEKLNGQKILLDGAHNLAGVETLRAALESFFPLPAKQGEEKPALIFGALADKDWAGICRVLAPLVSKIFTVRVASNRTADAGELAGVFRAANPAATVTAWDNLAGALNASKDEPFVVITGSLYLIGEALERLGFSPASMDERGLNEWTTPQVWR